MADSLPTAQLLTETSREGDLLQHRPLAQALADAVRATPSTESLGIALCSSWGQGKSTIGALLEECLRTEIDTQQIVFVRVDAWKYAHEGDRQPLRRHYLLRAYEAARLTKEAERLQRAFAQKVITQAVDERSQTVAIFLALGRWLKSKWLELAVAAAALISLAIFFPSVIATIILAVVSSLTVLIVVGATMIETVFRVLVAGLTVTAEEDPFRSIEEFDAQFTTLLTIDAKDVERFVFFIDDLDRCSDDIVIEAIETLQAFFGRPGCTYIVAADNRQLKRAVRAKAAGPVKIAESAIPLDETFLERIFQVTVHVPRLYPENLREYAKQISHGTQIGQIDGMEDVIGYLIHPHVDSPRQARVIINDFLMTYCEAAERERAKETHLTETRLTAAPLLMAKMVVLRAHFPWFFEELYDEPRLLLEWPQTFYRDLQEWSADETAADERVQSAAEQAAREAAAFERPIAMTTYDDSDTNRSIELLNGDADSEEDGAGVESIEQQVARGRTAGSRADALVIALRGYLILTGETAPDDAIRVEEFLYLRGRQGFAGLTGAAGRALRLSIGTGDPEGVAVAVSDDPTQAMPGAEAALDRLEYGTRLERSAARRALLELLKFLTPAELQAIGPNATRALYSDADEGQYEKDDVEGRDALVPWFDDRQLETHLNAAWPSHGLRLDRILERAHALGAEGTAVEALARDLGEGDLVQGLVDALRSTDRVVVSSYTESIAGLVPRLGSPTAYRRAIAFTPQSITGRNVTGIDGESGDEMTFTLPDALGWPVEEYLNQEVIVDLYEERSRFHAFSVVLSADPSIKWSTEVGEVMDSEARAALMLLFRTAFERAASIRGQLWSALANVNYQTEEEALEPLNLLQAGAEAARVVDHEAALRGILEGQSFRSPGSRRGAVVRVAASLDPSAVKNLNTELCAFIIMSFEYWDGDDAGRVGGDFSRLASILQETDVSAVGAASLASLGTDDRLRALRHFVARVDPAAAVAQAAAIVAEGLGDGLHPDEDAPDVVLDALDLMEDLAGVTPTSVDAALAKLDVRDEAPNLCERLVRVSAACGARTPLRPAVLRLASIKSLRGLQASIECVMRWSGELESSHGEALLTGVAEHADSVDPNAVTMAIGALRPVLQPLDQLGMLAQAGAVDLAEKLTASVGVDSHLQRELFRAARGVSTLRLKERRLRYAEAWSGRSRDEAKIAVKAYTAELGQVKTEDRLKLIVGSLLRYFPTSRDIPSRPTLRDALLKSIERVSPIKDEQLAELLRTARTQLPLETKSTLSKITRLLG